MFFHVFSRAWRFWSLLLFCVAPWRFETHLYRPEQHTHAYSFVSGRVNSDLFIFSLWFYLNSFVFDFKESSLCFRRLSLLVRKIICFCGCCFIRVGFNDFHRFPHMLILLLELIVVFPLNFNSFHRMLQNSRHVHVFSLMRDPESDGIRLNPSESV